MQKGHVARYSSDSSVLGCFSRQRAIRSELLSRLQFSVAQLFSFFPESCLSFEHLRLLLRVLRRRQGSHPCFLRILDICFFRGHRRPRETSKGSAAVSSLSVSSFVRGENLNSRGRNFNETLTDFYGLIAGQNPKVRLEILWRVCELFVVRGGFGEALKFLEAKDRGWNLSRGLVMGSKFNQRPPIVTGLRAIAGHLQQYTEMEERGKPAQERGRPTRREGGLAVRKMRVRGVSEGRVTLSGVSGSRDDDVQRWMRGGTLTAKDGTLDMEESDIRQELEDYLALCLDAQESPSAEALKIFYEIEASSNKGGGGAMKPGRNRNREKMERGEKTGWGESDVTSRVEDAMAIEFARARPENAETLEIALLCSQARCASGPFRPVGKGSGRRKAARSFEKESESDDEDDGHGQEKKDGGGENDHQDDETLVELSTSYLRRTGGSSEGPLVLVGGGRTLLGRTAWGTLMKVQLEKDPDCVRAWLSLTFEVALSNEELEQGGERDDAGVLRGCRRLLSIFDRDARRDWRRRLFSVEGSGFVGRSLSTESLLCVFLLCPFFLLVERNLSGLPSSSGDRGGVRREDVAALRSILALAALVDQRLERAARCLEAEKSSSYSRVLLLPRGEQQKNERDEEKKRQEERDGEIRLDTNSEGGDLEKGRGGEEEERLKRALSAILGSHRPNSVSPDNSGSGLAGSLWPSVKRDSWEGASREGRRGRGRGGRASVQSSRGPVQKRRRVTAAGSEGEDEGDEESKGGRLEPGEYLGGSSSSLSSSEDRDPLHREEQKQKRKKEKKSGGRQSRVAASKNSKADSGFGHVSAATASAAAASSKVRKETGRSSSSSTGRRRRRRKKPGVGGLRLTEREGRRDSDSSSEDVEMVEAEEKEKGGEKGGSREWEEALEEGVESLIEYRRSQSRENKNEFEFLSLLETHSPMSSPHSSSSSSSSSSSPPSLEFRTAEDYVHTWTRFLESSCCGLGEMREGRQGSAVPPRGSRSGARESEFRFLSSLLSCDGLKLVFEACLHLKEKMFLF
uniref:Uncharacterized protein n=1 Tax=Chromera velia CCMP2878 TaxID=1169474 RepID=A0A0G4G1S4_9ALVE|eukprot:Cvel_19855.t1-p1 / transcript=Cvel_19855.t1 / gene=Cvel_19855 / organism=Chromera_velia_CCMP2878 / gene_product=hypothetical protein / transcript_product=hypothetical protein / location=Cvel_scaffold1739:24601-33238(-) / protein_length=1026 / sequence_SO=supercontig / SO=protein_coding / is_pseudo=false